MVDKAFMKRWPDGRAVVVAQLTDKVARVRVGSSAEYHVIPIEEWRRLPLYNEADRIALGNS